MNAAGRFALDALQWLGEAAFNVELVGRDHVRASALGIPLYDSRWRERRLRRRTKLRALRRALRAERRK